MKFVTLYRSMSQSLVVRTGSLIVSVLFIVVAILLAGASPLEVATAMWNGAFGTPNQFARLLATLAPLLLCACGLVFTFATGLYNLGIEGQIMAGAIATTFILRLTQEILPAPLVILLGLGAGIAGGLIWGLLIGFLNVYAKVNEIFAGLGLNFVAQGLALYLIFGPWKRPGVASMSGTELFNRNLWLPNFGNTEASPIALLLAVVGLVVTLSVMRGTYFGLQLQAVGRNLRASYIQGIPAIEYLMSSFALCGTFAGLAGALQVLAVFHRLIPNISSNLGFLALLVVMLVNFNPLGLLPVAFFFSALNIGSLQLPLSLQLESSLAGVIQGTLVLFALLGQSLSDRLPKTTPGRS
ncbi:MAG: ABC transporter permease [Cyanobacteria bacterium FC1]|uniref:ABC transporter permease n=1 Tax=Desertifilum tharense TaxID=1185873 RepID=UPI003F7F6F7A|nr:ABC transporter permease [Cyanobacteria bacterium FC1]